MRKCNGYTAPKTNTNEISYFTVIGDSRDQTQRSKRVPAADKNDPKPCHARVSIP